MPRVRYANGLTKECDNRGCNERFAYAQDKSRHQNDRCPYRPVHRVRSFAPAVETPVVEDPFGQNIPWTDAELYTLRYLVISCCFFMLLLVGFEYIRLIHIKRVICVPNYSRVPLR